MTSKQCQSASCSAFGHSLPLARVFDPMRSGRQSHDWRKPGYACLAIARGKSSDVMEIGRIDETAFWVADPHELKILCAKHFMSGESSTQCATHASPPLTGENQATPYPLRSNPIVLARFLTIGCRPATPLCGIRLEAGGRGRWAGMAAAGPIPGGPVRRTRLGAWAGCWVQRSVGDGN